jgi:NAD(P)-dependent dehydrogenase (short-subunit alcohol dehydrogenase family)
MVIPTDVADAEQVEAAAEKVESTFGPIRVWVNNAVVTVLSRVWELKPDEIRRVRRHNAPASHAPAQAAFPPALDAAGLVTVRTERVRRRKFMPTACETFTVAWATCPCARRLGGLGTGW